MNNGTLKRTVSILLAVLSAFSLCLPAIAAESGREFKDMPKKGWMVPYMSWAVDNDLLSGYTDGTIRPKDPITAKQALTIVERMLAPAKHTPCSKLGIKEKAWYAKGVSGCDALGVDIPAGLLKSSTMTRGDAALILADAFQITGADEDVSVLARYPDCGGLRGTARDAMAAMVRTGCIQGSSGKLKPDSVISRVEFIAMLYRLVNGDGTDDPAERLLRGAVDVRGETPSDIVWVDGSATRASFYNVKAKTVIFRSQAASLELSGGSDIERLVIAGGSSDTMTFSVPWSAHIGTLVLGDGAPRNITVSGRIDALEITGKGLSVAVGAEIKKLDISGENCTVDMSRTQSATRVTLRDTSRGNNVALNGNAGELRIEGADNAVTLKGRAGSATLGGDGCSLSGTGHVESVMLISPYSSLDISCGDIKKDIDKGIDEVEIAMTVPELLPPGETLTVGVILKNPVERECAAAVLLDGEKVLERSVTVSPEGTELSWSKDFEYTEDMALSYELTVRLTYTDEFGRESSAEKSVELQLQNYDHDYYHYVSPEEALKRVTSKYAGDFTLQWALEHDYDDDTKTAWVNAKRLSSETEYLLWVNLTYQRVNVFTGSKGKWTLDRTFIASTGAPGHGTPRGTDTVIYHRARWYFEDYEVAPVVGFRTHYAFHSRPWNHGHTALVDDSMGFPSSEGCVRMYDEDVQWIFDNIPMGTTVIVY